MSQMLDPTFYRTPADAMPPGPQWTVCGRE
jgi:hypothetical protein